MTEIQRVMDMPMKQAAAYKGMEYTTFRYYVLDNRGPKVNREIGVHRYFLPADLDAWKPERKKSA